MLGKLSKLLVVSSIVLTLSILTFGINSGYASIRKEQALFSGSYLDIGLCGYRYSGPYWVQSGRTIVIEWAADRYVTVYILNEVDYKQWWWKYGGPPFYRTYKTAQRGTLEYYVNYADNFYIVVMGYAGTAARLYSWTEKLVWYENDPAEQHYIVPSYPTYPIEIRISDPNTVPEFPSTIILLIAISFLTLLFITLTKKGKSS